MSKEQQLAIALWAAMTTMVIEYADLPTAVVPQVHRDQVRLQQQIPAHWYIWISRYDPQDRPSTSFNHHGMQIINISPRGVAAIPVQTTGITMGRLYIQTALLHPRIGFDPASFVRAHKVLAIYPVTQELRDFPEEEYSALGFQVASNWIAESLGASAFVAPPKT